MQEQHLGNFISDQFGFYNNLWAKKVKGENVDSFSRLISSDFKRTVQLGEEDCSGLLLRGKIIFSDKKKGLNFSLDIVGNVDAVKDNEDLTTKNVTRILNGEAHFETNHEIVTAYFRKDKVVGAAYRHEKCQDMFGEKGVRFGDIISSHRQFCNKEGQIDGLQRFEQSGYGYTSKYENGVYVKDSKKTYRMEQPKRSQYPLIHKLLSLSFVNVLMPPKRSHDLYAIARGMYLRGK